jgi:hypothetical protein
MAELTREEELEALIAEQERDMRIGHRVFSISLDAARNEDGTGALEHAVIAGDGAVGELVRTTARNPHALISEHGTLNAYTNLGCRCARCREANRIECSRQKERRRRGIPSRTGYIPKHGTLTRYQNWCCRCTHCRLAAFEHRVNRGETSGAQRTRFYGNATTEISRNSSLPPQIRLHHSYREPVEGMCHGEIKVGAWLFGRCSHRATVGEFCGHHAKKAGLVEREQRCEARVTDGRQCYNRAKVQRGTTMVCGSHARHIDRTETVAAA